MLTAADLFPNHTSGESAARQPVQLRVWLRLNARIPIALARASLGPEYTERHDLGVAHDATIGRSPCPQAGHAD